MRSIAIFKTAVIILTTLLYTDALSQDPSPDSISVKFDLFKKKVIQEKMYVHTDQNFYLIGETVWFSVYCLDASFHKPLDISKVAYIELLDKSATSVLQTKVELQKGFGSGSVFLPATLQSGNYVLRGYTQWMRNFGSDFYFEKVITIINPFVKPEYDKPKQIALQAEFFPEGGHLVDNIQSKVGFRISSAGNPGKVTGALLDSNNDTVTVFSPLKFGLGHFVFTPQPDNRYRAVITDAGGQKKIFPLPESKRFGYAMSVSETDNRLQVTVTGNLPHADTAHVIYLLTHTRNIRPIAEAAYFNTRKKTFTIDIDKLPEGISHLTVFDENQKPVCERLYFKRPAQQLQLSARTLRQEYRSRTKADLQITTSAKSNDHISVAIYKADSLPGRTSANIFSYLWLLSDLTGNIESPEYYLTENDPAVKVATDNLMLTHGWRRFNWKKVLQAKPAFRFLPEYRGHLIRAKVTSKDSVAGGILTYLSIPGTTPQLYPARSNAEGEVLYEVGELKGRVRLIGQLSPNSQASSKFEFEDLFSGEKPLTPLPTFLPHADIEEKLLERSVAMQVQDIYHPEPASNKAHNDTVAFYGPADEIYYLDDYTRFPVMEEVMREYVPGVFVRKREDGFYFIVIDIVNGKTFSTDPMILLDGVPLFDADKIMEVDPRKIRKLDVVKRRYYLSSLTMDGIVSYTSYDGDMAGLQPDPSAVSIDYDALQFQREFPSPKYNTQKQFDSRIPDKRYLLYWNPNVTTKDGIADLEFFTSDVKGTFMVVAEGITQEGHAGSTYHFFTVK